MSTVSIPNQIQAGQPLDPRPVMANFDALALFINDDVLTLDGSKAMTGHLTLSGPGTAGGHAVTKAQLDDALGSDVAGGGFLPLAGGTLTGDLIVDGVASLRSNGVTFDVGCYGIAGHAGNPAFSSVLDSTTGMYVSSPGRLHFTLAGTDALHMNEYGLYSNRTIYGMDGNSSYPGFSFQTAVNTGFYLVAAGTAGVAGDLQVDGQIKAVAGQYTAPAITFAGVNSGFYGGAEYVATNVNGATKFAAYGDRAHVFANLQVDGTIVAGGQTFAPNGTRAKPAFSFANNQETGMWLADSNTIELSVGNERAVHFGRSDAAIRGVFMPGIHYRVDVGSTPNILLRPAGEGSPLHRTSSSRRYLKEIEATTFAAEESVYELAPSWFRANDKTETDTALSHYGFIAEDVAAVDPRLVSYAETEDGDRHPDSVNTPAITALMLGALKRQRDTIADLAARVEALEGQKGL